MRILYGLLLFFFNIIYCLFHTFRKIVLAIAIFLLVCFFAIPATSDLAAMKPTILEWILFTIYYLIIPIIIFLLYKPSEKIFSPFINFLSSRFCSYLSNEELYYQHKTAYSETNNSSSDHAFESSDSEQEDYSNYADEEAYFEEYDFSNTESTINLFSGVNNLTDLKKRYRDLLKIYHPDNSAGDEAMTKQIQSEYEQLLEYYNDKT